MTNEFLEFLNEFVRRSVYPNREHLPSFWIETESVLGRFPDQYIWPVEPSDKVAPWVVDTISLNAWYWSDIVKRINAVAFLQSAKLKTLLQGIESAALENNLLVLTLLLRSLFENCATLYGFGVLVEGRLTGFDPAVLTREQVVHKEFEDELIVFSHGSRFNWQELLTGDLDKWINAPDAVKPEYKQKNILTRVQKVAAEERYGAFELLYAWLCDYVHPNMGSHLLYLRDEAVVEGGAVRMELGRVASRKDTIRLLALFTGGILACLEIISQKLPAIIIATEPTGNWCKRHYIHYVQMQNGSCRIGERDITSASAVRRRAGGPARLRARDSGVVSQRTGITGAGVCMCIGSRRGGGRTRDTGGGYAAAEPYVTRFDTHGVAEFGIQGVSFSVHSEEVIFADARKSFFNWNLCASWVLGVESS